MGKKSKSGGSSKKTAAPAAETVPIAAKDRLPLLTEIGDSTPKFKRCLLELFNRFDVDGDKLLSGDELQNFAMTANADGRHFNEGELKEVKEYFDWKEVPDGVSGLTLRGFLEMYHTQTAGEEEETWRDLYRLGYNGQLELRVEGCRTANAGLQAQLEKLLALAESKDIDAFVPLFVPSDVTDKEREAYIAKLRQDDFKELCRVTAELRCCCSGEGVYEIEDDSKKIDYDGTIAFNFKLDGNDGSRAFFQDEGEWRTEGCFSQLVAEAKP